MTRRPKRAARKAARRFIDDEAGDDSIRGSQRSGSVGSYQQDSFVAPDGEVEEVADTDFDGIIPDEDVFPPSLADSDSDSEIDEDGAAMARRRRRQVLESDDEGEYGTPHAPPQPPPAPQAAPPAGQQQAAQPVTPGAGRHPIGELSAERFKNCPSVVELQTDPVWSVKNLQGLLKARCPS